MNKEIMAIVAVSVIIIIMAGGSFLQQPVIITVLGLVALPKTNHSSCINMVKMGRFT